MTVPSALPSVPVTTVRLATLDDIPRLGRSATRAFADDPVMRWFFPDDNDYEQTNPMLVQFMVRRWHATDSVWCTDDAVAMAGWVPPGRPDVSDIARPAVDHPQWRIDRFTAIGAALGENTPEEPHWYLNMLATHPDWQRQGLGAALMRAGFEIAADMGLPCYLETETLENVAYYRHHGFEVRTEWALPLGGPHMWGMLRAD
jgi:ribosomal protein S18 acetylase RimI-like enzyme